MLLANVRNYFWRLVHKWHPNYITVEYLTLVLGQAIHFQRILQQCRTSPSVPTIIPEYLQVWWEACETERITSATLTRDRLNSNILKECSKQTASPRPLSGRPCHLPIPQPILQRTLLNLNPQKSHQSYSVPYVRGLSERLEKVCKPLGVQPVFKPPTTLKQSLVKLKARTTQEKKKEVVYQVPCGECDEVYLGETKRTLKVRLSEHRKAVRRGDTKNGIAVHVQQSQHSIKEEAKVERRKYQDTGRDELGKPSWFADNHITWTWTVVSTFPLFGTHFWTHIPLHEHSPTPFSVFLCSNLSLFVLFPLFPFIPPYFHHSVQHLAWRHMVPVFK